MRVGYVDEVDRQYVEAMENADTLGELVAVIAEYKQFAHDAMADVRGWSEKDFLEFRSALETERSGEFAGEEAAKRFGAVMMPETLLQVSAVAQYYSVPWGTAFIRLKETGQLIKVGDHFEVKDD